VGSKRSLVTKKRKRGKGNVFDSEAVVARGGEKKRKALRRKGEGRLSIHGEKERGKNGLIFVQKIRGGGRGR